MADIQDKINEILSNPEALRQVQSLGEQLGLSGSPPERQVQQESKNKLSLPSDMMNDDIAKSLFKILPAIKSVGGEDDTTRLLNALRPFLSPDKQAKIDKAEKMLRMFKVLPLLKDMSLF